MSCECYQIGGPFIAEDPECPTHGREAMRVQEDHDSQIQALRDEIYELKNRIYELERSRREDVISRPRR